MFSEREPREYHGAIVDLIERCNCSRVMLTLDPQLERKLPGVLGPDVDCERCSWPFPYEREARKRGQRGMTEGLLPGAG